MINDPRDLPAGGYFEGAEHRYPLRVFFEDTDAGGVVYHGRYLGFLERARSDMLRVAGIDHVAAYRDGIGLYTIVEVRIRYVRPARLDDALLVTSTVERMSSSSCIVAQNVLRNGELIASASVKAAFVTPAGRPTRQPAEWIETFERLKRDD
jgi:acyl-CoA thioester hydrolase